ncbi:MAG: PIN domain-containing protein [Chloroflexi bacterium]|nr:PIN domain-containing protein [Chloroflexota bacterium]
MPAPFLDTNILLRHLLADHPEQSPRATAFLQRVEDGEAEVYTSDTVVFELVFTLQRLYKQPKDKITKAVLPLIELPGVILPGKRRYRAVFDLFVDLNLPFADAYHAVLMKHLRTQEIISFDRDFERINGVHRLEP